MSNVPSRETFESIYAGKAPLDTGKPQPASVEAIDLVEAMIRPWVFEESNRPVLVE